MKRLLSSLPVWIILCDMLYGFGLNVMQSQNVVNMPSAKTVTPDIAFNGLQLAANGGMILIIGFGLLVLLQLNRTVLQQQILPIGIFRSLGLLAVLAFSVPSLWEWFWAVGGLFSGKPVFNTGDIRYFITALCLPLTALLCLIRLFGWYRLHGKAEHDEN
ncbi:hypothetical protein [Neisseria animalis]|uniref:Uncharacterized protein n=1 Tax=Neisseria animalis TaxID=492 RepID=A0A5P3MQQ2_NEIAN|nr:hypothetical protein [Neisseria animalis]QEY23923.1 hypothetical protein D0T90_04930 [Neisseria animalis]ROW31485.1 hypothetical protein CGZ60_10045 [Neisseria animalis]